MPTTLVNNSGFNDAFIAKYSDTGYVNWATRIAGSQSDIGSSIVTDTSNNIYVTGVYYSSNGITLYHTNGVGHTTLNNSGSSNIFIAKYSNTGYVNWATRIGGTGLNTTISITTDSLNNIYVGGNYNNGITLYNANGVGGTTLTNSGVYDSYIAKYSDTGYVNWTTRIGGTGSDNINSIVTDNLNNIYVTGNYNYGITLYHTNGIGDTTFVNNSGNNDAFIAKYSDTGYVKWTTRIAGGGIDSGISIVPDNLNNIYVGGNYNFLTTLYNANGVGGTTLNNSGFNDAFIAKYSDTGYVQWATRIGGTGGDNLNSIVTDNLNNIYVTGSYLYGITLYHTNGVGHTTLNNSNIGNNLYIAKYSDTGYVKWATRIEGTTDDVGQSITTDSLNNIYVAGKYYDNGIILYNANGVGDTTLNNSGDYDSFIAKYSDTGYVQWATYIGGTGVDTINSIVTDNLNNIYVTGSYSYGITLYDTTKIIVSSGNEEIIDFKHYLLYTKPSYTFSEQKTSSERMFDLKNKTQYAYFKNNSNPNNINDCNLPIKNSSYQIKDDIRRGSAICNMNNIIQNN